MSGRGTALRIERLSKHFRGVQALRDVSFVVPRGEIVGIIGPNGSGKTTLVNAITGFVRPDHGSIWFDHRDLARMPPHAIASAGVVRTFQTARSYHVLSALESVVVALYSPRARGFDARGRWGERASVATDLLEEVGFERDSFVPGRGVAALPQGYLRRLELARCLAVHPDVILADELFSGLSPAEIASVVPLMDKLRSDGVTLVLVEHRLRELFRIADRILVMREGRLVHEASPRELIRDDAFRELYLGEEVADASD